MFIGMELEEVVAAAAAAATTAAVAVVVVVALCCCGSGLPPPPPPPCWGNPANWKILLAPGKGSVKKTILLAFDLSSAL